MNITSHNAFGQSIAQSAKMLTLQILFQTSTILFFRIQDPKFRLRFVSSSHIEDPHPAD